MGQERLELRGQEVLDKPKLDRRGTVIACQTVRPLTVVARRKAPREKKKSTDACFQRDGKLTPCVLSKSAIIY